MASGSGDRIQIGTVVGEVLDIGLVRLHLRELNQQGPLGATGRVVAFANLSRLPGVRWPVQADSRMRT